eukprot:TRINITY_DN16844_c0_g1_i1.p2 TRINITY_DN16844_c0_g1~~TRINITY_DN16844_c0_g1_i1.p2  ORF type:complete len:135 (-),score=42.69 TRINITY_DN16844_c0_g1_i1:93-497(-)
MSTEKEEKKSGTDAVHVKRTDVIDLIWHCYTLGHQASHYYRHGGLDLCTDASAAFWDVVKRGTQRTRDELAAGTGHEPHWKSWHADQSGVPKGDPPRMPVPLFTARAVPLGSAEVFGAAAAANADWVEPAEAQP